VSSDGHGKSSNLVNSGAVGSNRVVKYCSVYQALLETLIYMHRIVCGSLKPDRDSPGQSAPQALRTDHEFICDQILLDVF